MKKHPVCFALLAALLVLLLGCAAAEDVLSPGAEACLRAALPGADVSLVHQCGNTAAAVLIKDGTQTLCIAEQKEGAWEAVIVNGAALRQDDPVTDLLLDTDDSLFWTYNSGGPITDRYHAQRIDGQWRVMGLICYESYENGYTSEYQLSYYEGCLQYTTFFCDENDNPLSQRNYTPVPAAWLEALMPLAVYEDARFPYPVRNYTHSWLSEEATVLAAQELFPEYTFLGGCAEADHLAFFLQKENSGPVIAACRFSREQGWQTAVSSSLPEGTSYGRENFSSSLAIGDLLVNIGPVGADTFGLTFLYNTAETHRGDRFLYFGRSWISMEPATDGNRRFGDHPWADIRTMDWQSLPHSPEEAYAKLDASGWAVVNNPNPADRLHLRAEPDRAASSLGRYYNGTPLRILEEKDDWARVDIFGITGWMMKEYLAFGEKGHTVERALPTLVQLDDKVHHYVFETPATDRPIISCEYTRESLLVLAVVDEKWYHVWFPEDDLTGYVLMANWGEGNG